MSTHVSFRDGGQTSQEGLARLASKLLTRDGAVNSSDLLVVEHSPQNASVDVSLGDVIIGENSPYNSTLPEYAYHGWVSVAENVAITSNTSGNPRIDAIVAYIDLAVVDDTLADNPGVLKCIAVAGTAAATPSAPSDATIQAAVGALNPWVPLAHVAVANGFSTIVDANITDKRPEVDSLERLLGAIVSDFVETGLVWSQTSGLVGGMTAGRALVAGRYVHKPIIAKTFTASKDTYVDLPNTAYPTSTDDLTYTAVANGAASPALAAGSIRLAKVVTNGSAITSVTTSGRDSIDQKIRPTWAVEPADSAITTRMTSSTRQAGWETITETMSCAADNTITATAGLVATLSLGDKVSFTDDGTAYMGWVIAKPSATTFKVIGGTFTAGGTGHGAYAIVTSGSVIAAPYYSKVQSPKDFPDWLNLSSITAFLSSFDDGAGGQPTLSHAFLKIDGKRAELHIRQVGYKVGTDTQVHQFGDFTDLNAALPPKSNMYASGATGLTNLGYGSIVGAARYAAQVHRNDAAGACYVEAPATINDNQALTVSVVFVWDFSTT